jgi:hypothetical protein
MFRPKSMLPCAAAVLVAAQVLPAAAADSAGSTTISGKIYADFTNLDLTNGGVDSSANGTGIDVKRFYLGVTHNFDDIWSVNLTTDFNYVSDDSETQLYVKKAYIQARLSDALVLRAGSADLPWVPFVEDLYGLRFVENVIIDRLKFGTSADWGVHALGKVADGKVNYDVAIINGAGYKNPTRTNSMDLEARVAFVPLAGLSLALGGYSGKLGKDVEGGAPALHTAQRLDALAAYVAGPLRIGAEYFQARNWTQVTSVATDKADGFSVWGSYDFNPKLGVFARGDWAKPSKELNSDLKDEYFNVGLVSHPRENIDVALVYKRERVTGGGVISTSNGNIGSTSGTGEGKYDEIGIWAQAVF